MKGYLYCSSQLVRENIVRVRSSLLVRLRFMPRISIQPTLRVLRELCRGSTLSRISFIIRPNRRPLLLRLSPLASRRRRILLIHRIRVLRPRPAILFLFLLLALLPRWLRDRIFKVRRIMPSSRPSCPDASTVAVAITVLLLRSLAIICLFLGAP